MELGSQSVLLHSSAMEYTYSIARETAPGVFLMANIGASSLIEQQGRTPCTLDQIRQLLDIIRADALTIHLNFLQESVMPEGDSRARGCLNAIEGIVREIGLPVVLKETGAGISRAQAERLKDIGVSALEIGGAGGTSMALLESQRARRNNDLVHEALGATFAHWGIPTPVSLVEARSSGLPIVASGGITNGLEAAKALALGATLVGVARPLHIAAARGLEAVVEWLELFFEELSVAMFLSAASTISILHQRKTLVLGRTKEWLEQLGHDVMKM
jgi:isopentenyl-diphosphate delta-isomerase